VPSCSFLTKVGLFFIFDQTRQPVAASNSVTVWVVRSPSHRIIVSDCFPSRRIQALAPAREVADHSCQLSVFIADEFQELISSFKFVVAIYVKTSEQ
jgi:hypothetical protein